MKEIGRAGSIRLRSIAILSVTAVASVAPYFFAASGRMPQSHDITVHWMRMLAFDEVLRSGVWYPRWLGAMNDGYGAATTIFYPPFFYYAVSLGHAIFHDWRISLIAVAAAAAVGSGLWFYAYARLLVDRVPALIASLAYLLLPYHLIDLYHRGAFPELIAFVWMPAIMYCFTKAARERIVRHLAMGSAAFALLILTHPPEAYLFSLALSVYATVWSILSRRLRPALAAAGIVTLGFGLAAFYALPAILETGYIQQTITDSFRYSESYLPRLFSSGSFGVMLGVTAIATACVLLVSVVRLSPVELKKNSAVVGWLLIAVLAILMMTPISAPFVKALPRFEAVAFSWRWLAILTMAASLFVGFGVQAAQSMPKTTQLVSIFIVLAGAIVFGIVASASAANLRVQFEPPAHYIERDFTPASVSGSPALIAPGLEPATERTGAETILWKPQERILITRSTEPFTLHVQTYYFPGWTAEVDGVPVRIRSDARGLISIETPEGEHTIHLEFRNTPLRRRAEQISLVASGLLLTLLIGGAFERGSPSGGILMAGEDAHR